MPDRESPAASRPRMWRLIERYMGERFVYVYADSKAEALRVAREGDTVARKWAEARA